MYQEGAYREETEIAIEGSVRPGLGSTLERIHEVISGVVEEQLTAAAGGA